MPEDLIEWIVNSLKLLLSNQRFDKQGRPINGPRPIYFKNDSGEAIPPYSIMHITGTEEVGSQNFLKVAKFDDSVIGGGFLFSNHNEIEDDGFGIAQPGPVYRMQGDGSTITAGKLWGPVDGEWTVADNGGPYLACGADDIADDVLWGKPDVAQVYPGVSSSVITGGGTGTMTIDSTGQTGMIVHSKFTNNTPDARKVVAGRGENGRLELISEDCTGS